MAQIRHKFRAERAERDGYKFGSKKEARYYDYLKMMESLGQVVGFLRQTPFHFPGGKWSCDFIEFWADGSVVVTDVKGYDTPESRRIRKIVMANYPWIGSINIVTKVPKI